MGHYDNGFNTRCFKGKFPSSRRITDYFHWVKSFQIRSFFWSVFSCIQSEYRKIRTWKKSVFGHFLRCVAKWWIFRNLTLWSILSANEPSLSKRIVISFGRKTFTETYLEGVLFIKFFECHFACRMLHLTVRNSNRFNLLRKTYTCWGDSSVRLWQV